MRQPTILLLLCFILLFATTSPEPQPAVTFRPGKDHAILFAVNTYKAPLTNLTNPITNARQIATELQNRFGFKPQIVENPTSAQIEQILQDYANRFARNLNGEYPATGQLFIFFSGHGTEQLENGFFLPADADMNNLRQTGLQYSYLRPLINAINCQHILVAVDACYSVTFDEDYKKKSGFVFRRPGELSENDKILANHEQYKARIFFTSDAVGDMTPDKSNFAKKLLEGLRTFNAQNGFMTSSELFANYLQKASPTPHGGEFGADEAGSTFLFFPQEKPTNFDLQSYEQRQRDIQAWTTAQSANTPAAYLDYLQKFPQGTFRDQATKALTTAEEDQEWDLARLSNNPTAYQAYLSRYPTGRYAAEAKKNQQLTTAPDRDKDGVPDSIDRCPDQLGPTSNNGCPLPPPVPPGMVLVKGGTFQMGDVMGDNEKDDETIHTVTVSNFFLAKNELTFEDYDAYCKATGRELPSDSGWGRGKRPVINVDWYDAIEYCNWRSGKEGLQVVYSINKKNKDFNNSSDSDTKKWLVTTSRTANGYRLPTEAEWEFAARQGGKKSRFGNGKDIADPSDINFNGTENYKKAYSVGGENRQKTFPVGSFSPNNIDLFDMSGNVWEWCGDWYGPYLNKATTDPIGATRGSRRVNRGGSWYDNPTNARVAYRLSVSPGSSSNFIGFRLARTVGL